MATREKVSIHNDKYVHSCAHALKLGTSAATVSMFFCRERMRSVSTIGCKVLVSLLPTI